MNRTVTTYVLHGKNVVHLTQGSNNLHFFYGADGSPAIVEYNGVSYGYVKNLQGDVIGIVNASGAYVVQYAYDAWGKLLSKTGSMASTLGTLNPFRYRGYVYDEETGLYYLRNRYYSPIWSRFMNGDTSLAGMNNVFAYCDNKPIEYHDQDGLLFLECFVGALVGALSQYVSDVVENVADGKSGWDVFTPHSDIEDYVIAAAEGAVTAIPGMSTCASAFIDVVVEPCVSTAADYLLGRDDFDADRWGANLVGDMAENAVDFVLFDEFASNIPDPPRYIRDIKKDAVSQGIRGTKKLKKFLKKKYWGSIFKKGGASVYYSGLATARDEAIQMLFLAE